MIRQLRPGNALHSILIAVATIVALSVSAASAGADPSLGFVEDWPGTSLQGWGGGALYENPGSGGTLGAGDGFLRIYTPTSSKLASMSLGPAYAGDWLAAGIQLVRFSLNDVGPDEALEIHFCIGNTSNFWISNAGFSPPENAWQQFTVDVTSSAGFTRIIGSGTFEDALRHVDRIQIRHDLPPLVQAPDDIQADFGVDHLILTDATTRVRSTTWGRIKDLYR